MDIHRVFALLLRPFRQRRMQRFVHSFNLESHTTVLDVGGTVFNWSLIETRPRLVLSNLMFPQDLAAPETTVLADGCSLPFRDQSFEVVFSNSVIEHVGEQARQTEFAAEIDHVGQSYFVQTPNKWFALEPHLLTPFVPWLPRRVQPLVIRNLTILALISRSTREWTETFLETTRLLGRGDLAGLFPDAEVRRERFLGFTKSLVAVKARSRA